MGRLVAFGCSHTLGVWLPDNTHLYRANHKHIHPSKFAWPNVLGAKLNLVTINNAVAGSGNLQIFNKVRQFEFLPDDLCIIMWSHFVRHDNFIMEDVGRGSAPPLSEWLLRNELNEKWWITNTRIKNWLTIEHCGFYLQHKNVKFYQLLSYTDPDTQPKPNVYTPNFLITNSLQQYAVDYADDYNIKPPGHVGVKTHEIIAQVIYEKMLNYPE